MSKVITTKTHGNVLTSPVNAHSLTRGDQIILGGPSIHTVTSTSDLGPDQYMNSGMAVVLHLVATTGLIADADPAGHPWSPVFDANQPIDRIVGARSAGQI